MSDERKAGERTDGPPGLVAYEVTAEHTLFVFDLPRLPADCPLSPAEREVTERILLGETNAAIAALRGVSVPTIAKQVASVFVKLGVRSRAELIATLLRPR